MQNVKQKLLPLPPGPFVCLLLKLIPRPPPILSHLLCFRHIHINQEEACFFPRRLWNLRDDSLVKDSFLFFFPTDYSFKLWPSLLRTYLRLSLL